MEQFRSFRIHQNEDGVSAGFEELEIDDLTEGEVVIRVSHSNINYKDALAATGKGRILRRPVLNGGVDLAGSVITSSDDQFGEGDEVLVCGAGLSELFDGGYSEVARVPTQAVVKRPPEMSAEEAMSIGTAGFTAALAVIRMEQNGQDPAHGPIVVTGATGGVGSIAIDLLSARGYEVVALTGKEDQHPYLSSIGATDFLDRKTLDMGTRPLEKTLWGGAVDNVGGDTLGWLTRTVKPFGNIASIGLAGGFKLSTTVMPFILRGVSLLGINSVELPMAMRDEAWVRLGEDLKPRHLDKIITRRISFDQLPDAFAPYIEGSMVGRTVVAISG